MTETSGDLDGGVLSSPGFWLHRAALTWRHELERALTDLQLTPAQFTILASIRWLRAHGKTSTQKQIANLCGDDPAMTSRLVRGLEDRGLVRRTGDLEDRRAIQAVLTTMGQRLLDDAEPAAARADARIFNDRARPMGPALRQIAERRERPR